jgi:hypothetical protein
LSLFFLSVGLAMEQHPNSPLARNLLENSSIQNFIFIACRKPKYIKKGFNFLM